MNRSEFLKNSIALGSLALAGKNSLFARDVSGPLDLLLKNCLIVDGTGGPAFHGDVGIRGDRIVKMGRMDGLEAKRTIDVGGQVVVPGFIDIHSHSDLTLLSDGKAESKIYQGVTTEVVGQDGRSMAPLNPERKSYFKEQFGFDPPWNDFTGYFNTLVDSGISLNVSSMVGAGTLREYVLGREERQATSDELMAMKSLMLKSRREGAGALSSGLEYLPGKYADANELAVLASVSILYSTHTRNEDDYVEIAVKEAIWIARKAGVPLNLSHLKAQGRRNWGKLPGILEHIQAALDEGIPVTCDRYPYTAYASRLITLFPAWARDRGLAGIFSYAKDPHWRTRMKTATEEKVNSIGSWDDIMFSQSSTPEWAPYQGQRLGEIARRRGVDPYRLLLQLLSSGGGGSMVVFAMGDDNLRTLFQLPYCAVASDGAALSMKSGGNPHPRNYGTFPEFLSRFVREEKLISLETAIRKMTSLPATIAGIPDRGILASGYFADLVVFDPGKIGSPSRYENPSQKPEGIGMVLVNGVPVVESGEHTGKMPGQIVKTI